MAKKITPQIEEETLAEVAKNNINVVFLKDYNHPEIAAGLDFKAGDAIEVDPITFSNILSEDPDAIELAE